MTETYNAIIGLRKRCFRIQLKIDITIREGVAVPVGGVRERGKNKNKNKMIGTARNERRIDPVRHDEETDK